MTKKMFSHMAAVLLMLSTLSMTYYIDYNEVLPVIQENEIEPNACQDVGVDIAVILIEEGEDVNNSICVGTFFSTICQGGDLAIALINLANCIE